MSFFYVVNKSNSVHRPLPGCSLRAIKLHLWLLGLLRLAISNFFISALLPANLAMTKTLKNITCHIVMNLRHCEAAIIVNIYH